MAAHTQCDGGQSPRALIYENLPEPEPFWEPEEPDCWQRDDDDFADPDHNPIRMQRIESQYWAAREADKLVAPIGDLVRQVFTSIERRCLDPAFAAIQTLRGLTYHEYLKTEHWQKTRTVALNVGHHECRICARTKQLDVHHRTYKRLGCEDQRDLVVLCHKCHELFHSHGRLAVQESGS